MLTMYDPFLADKKPIGEGLNPIQASRMAEIIHARIVEYCKQQKAMDGCLYVISRERQGDHRKLSFNPGYAGCLNNTMQVCTAWRIATPDEARACLESEEAERLKVEKEKADIAAISHQLALSSLIQNAAQAASKYPMPQPEKKGK
ncbi:MAG TPA: hypothetical protein VGP72_10450 [Planctomycetota bacterium]|jgi:hypothetical protein